MTDRPAAGDAPVVADTPLDPVTITTCPDGPLLVRGDFTIRTPQGAAIEAGRRTVALCRCGGSGSKPFCDGSHKVTGWHSDG